MKRTLAGLLLAIGSAMAAAPPAAAWRQEIREALFVPETLPPLEAQTHSTFEPEPGVIAERVSYSTQYGMRIPAILYRPKVSKGRIPALIVVNGHGGDKYSWYSFYSGILYARAGAAVLTYDPLGEGERNPRRKSGTRAHDKLERNRELGRRMAGQMIVDVMQAVSYLAARPEIDARRIAAMGYSLGSFVLALAGAVETRLNACVLVGGGNLDGPGEYWDLAKPLCTGYPYQALSFLGDRPAALYAMHAARGATYLFNGLDDGVVNIPGAGEAYLRALQKRVRAQISEGSVFEFGFVPHASHRPYFVTRPVALWLERKLDFPAWDQNAIRSLPETHVSAWAASQGVEIDAGYASELSEGGTMALAAGVPGVKREKLNVFPDEDWTANRARLVIDEWARQVRARLGEQPSATPAGSLYLVREGRPQATVVVSANATADEREAAEQLVAYVERATGAKLPVTSSASTGVRVYIGVSACPPPLSAEMRSVRPSGFLIRTTTDGALCLGGVGSRGSTFAVHAFLEEFAGVRWLWPGKLGEVVPKLRSLAVPPTRIHEVPAFAWRDLGPRGPLWGPLDKWQAERKLGVTEEHQLAQALWERRNRFGGMKIYGGHAFAEMLPPAKYGIAHPEYFALVGGKRDSNPQGFDGKHGRQPCTSNPDVVGIVAEYCDRFFREHPDYDAFSISLNDGRGFCECQHCRALDTGEMQQEGSDPETGAAARYPVITDRVIAFANQVAERLVREHRDKKLILFAYGQYKQPPKRVKPHPNLIIQYTMHTASHWTPALGEQQFRELGAWSGSARHLAIYEYYIQGSFPDLPRLMPELIQAGVRRLQDLGYRYYQTQHGAGYAINGFNYYLLSKLLWNPALDAAAIRRDYAEKGFGKASPAVIRYLDRMATQWKQTGGTLSMDYASIRDYQRVLEAYPPPFLKHCREDLDQARRAVDGEERERVAFLERGLRYTELTLAAVEQTLPLLEAGWKFGRAVSAPSNASRGDLGRAMAAWEARDRYVELLKNDFALAYVWIRYNDSQRSFNPLVKMREWTESMR